MEIKSIYKFIFLELVEKRDLYIKEQKKTNRGRKKLIQSNEIFYDEIVKVIINGKKWRDVKGTASYSVYFKKYQEWSDNNIFKEAYYILVLYLCRHRYITHKQLHNCYIDSTMIRNKQGVDCIGKNYSDKFKNGTKSSVIVTKNGIPIALSIVPANVHDINIVEDTISNSIIKLNNTSIGADKGYISKKLKDKLKIDKNIEFITEYKKNNKNTENKNKNISFLKNRYIIENFFAWLKNNKKIQLRYDKYIHNYTQNNYLSFGLVVQNKFKNYSFNITKRMVTVYENKIISGNLINSFLL